jgi:hypothetical protein
MIEFANHTLSCAASKEDLQNASNRRVIMHRSVQIAALPEEAELCKTVAVGGEREEASSRQLLRLAVFAPAIPAASRIARAQTSSTHRRRSSSLPPLAERIAGYADELRFDDLDDTTIERVKSRVIDSSDAGPRRSTSERCASEAQAGGVSSVIGTELRTTPDQRRCLPLLRPERCLRWAVRRPSERPHSGMPRPCGGV